MFRKIFRKYPQVYKDLKQAARTRYNALIKEPIMKHKRTHIEDVNKASSYANYNMRFKRIKEDTALQPAGSNDQAQQSMFLRKQFRQRINVVNNDFSRVISSLNEMVEVISADLFGMNNRVTHMKKNMESLRSENEQY
jgi:hypothetical protein